MSEGAPESLETDTPLVSSLEALSLKETARMREIRQPLIEAMQGQDVAAIRELLGAYQEEGEKLIDGFAPAKADPMDENALREKLQARLVIATALLWQEADRVDKFGNNLLLALIMSKDGNFNEFTETLRSALGELINPPPVEDIIRAFKKELSDDSYEELGSLEASTPERAIEDIAEFMLKANTQEQAYDFLMRMGWGKG